MEAKTCRRVLSMFLAVALAACTSGSDGQHGADGPAGPPGVDGKDGHDGRDGLDGSSIGSVIGRLTFVVGGNEYPAQNVQVTSIPDWCHPTFTDANGEYELGSGCPIGVYTVRFSGNGFETLEVPNIPVIAGKNFVLNRELVALSPITLTTAWTLPAAVGGGQPAFAGFGAYVAFGVTASGGTPPYTYKWTPRATNPTAAAIVPDDGAAGSFSTGSIADIIAGGKVIGLGRSLDEEGSPFRNELLAVSVQQLAQLTYNFDVVVKDAMGFEKKATLAVPTATLAQGNASVPTGTLIMASFPGNAAALAFQKPAGSNASLQDAAGEYPWFIADAPGIYMVGDLRLAASSYVGSTPDCGGCHEFLMSDEKKAAFADKFKKWNNSAHGNHFFKYMEYDGDVLVWKKGADGRPLPAPTANPTVFWDEPGAMTTFEFGMTGAEGTHYGANCVACHTTGYNAALNSGGFDDVAKAAGWTFPKLADYLTDLTTGTDPTGEAVTPEPQYGAFDLVPAAAKALIGMQCESCHGPVGQHFRYGNFKPVGEYSVGACAVCHDRPSNHDRVALWRRSGHANEGLALAEGVGSGSCVRCHSAQGYSKYAADTTQGTVDGGATEASVQPQTCAACHDSHATTVRITGEEPVYTAAGFYVEGAGTGALCMTCHNGRRGLRGDDIPMTSIQTPHAPTQTEVLMGMNAYFLGNAAGFNVSGHAAVAETCVGCHMKTAVAGLRFTNTNHTFGFTDDKGADAAMTICGECHGEEVNGEAIEVAYENARETVVAQLGATLLAAVAGTDGFYVTPAGEGHGAPSGTPLLLQDHDIASIGVDGSTLVFDLNTPIAVEFPSGTVQTTTVRCSAANLKDATNTFALLGKDGVVSRSLWNLGLVNDGSRSIHNPTFVFDVLQATDAALDEATPASACADTCL